MAFFDHWLKGDDNGVMDGAPVRVQVRTGNGGHYVSEEAEWPIARTTYRRWYLDATPVGLAGRRTPHRLPAHHRRGPHGRALGRATTPISTSARRIPAPIGYVGGTPRWSTGVTFVSEPLAEDMVLAGYMKAGLWVSSTSADMDVFVSLRVLDENDREIRYESLVPPVDPTSIHPAGHGLLKVSHRKLDEERSTDYWPVHTHTEARPRPAARRRDRRDRGRAQPEQRAVIRKGCRLRVDVQPYSPAGLTSRAYDESYHVGATNTLYTGPDHPSYVQLPI